MARIAYTTSSEEEYLQKLEETTLLDLKALDCVRHIIKRNIEKGLLPNYCEGLISLDTQYNTIGVIGIYETMKFFGYTTQDELGNTYYTTAADEFGKKIFEAINKVKDSFVKNVEYKISIEQIPGESAANKLQQADEFLYPEKVVKDLPLYGNQFIPLGVKTNIQERVRIASLFDSYCNGGSIAHINIDAPFDSFEKAWYMLNYVADTGLTYFAFNTKIQACAKNHAFYGDTCPVCGGKVETEYSRIVGFYVPVKTWSKERKAEYKMREWENVNG